ncbi:MAG: SWIM zinc finger family protein [Thermodesulfobacteriota bacterium]
MSSFQWRPYVPVAKRRAAAARHLEKMRKKGFVAQPVAINGRTIAHTFWGRGWCDHMESFHDFANRLPRGRTYVRNGSVCHLAIEPGRIEAMVIGSELYEVAIAVKPLAAKRWGAIRAACAGKIASLVDLLRGKLADGVMEVVCHRQTGLFPLPGEISLSCSCPDWASMCKHVAAVLYGVGARLDETPEELFRLRGVDHLELVDVSAAVQEATRRGSSRRRLAADSLGDVFGIELAPEPEREAAAKAPARGRGRKRDDPPAPPGPAAGTTGPPASPAPPPVMAGGRGAATRQRKAAATAVSAPPAPRPVSPAGDDNRVGEAKPASTMPKTLTGYAIRKWRHRRGWTQAALGRAIGVSAACICQWEGKERRAVRPQPPVRAAWEAIWDQEDD